MKSAFAIGNPRADQSDFVAELARLKAEQERLCAECVASGRVVPTLASLQDDDIVFAVELAEANIALLRTALRCGTSATKLVEPDKNQQPIATQQRPAPSDAANNATKEERMNEDLTLTELCLQRKGKPLPTRAGPSALTETQRCIAAKGEPRPAAERLENESETQAAMRLRRERAAKT
jgi:hypothetical protein